MRLRLPAVGLLRRIRFALGKKPAVILPRTLARTPGVGRLAVSSGRGSTVSQGASASRGHVELEAILDRAPEPASAVTEVLLEGEGLRVAEAALGAVARYEVLGDIEAHALYPEALDGDGGFRRGLELGSGAPAGEPLLYLVADQVGAVRGRAVGDPLEEALVGELLVGGGELLSNLGGVLVGA